MTEDKVFPHAEADVSASLADAVEETLRRDKARRFRKGDRVKGKVARFSESMAFVELAGGEGMIDLTRHRQPDGSLDLTEGQEIEAIIIDVAANGVMLEKALITEMESIEQLAAAQAAGLPVQARVVGHNKGGLELELFGVRAFCPASQIELHKVEDFGGYVGRTYQFRIQQVEGRKVVLSRRALLAEEREQKRGELRARLQPGAVLTGTVVRLQPFGAFVDLGEGIEGLVHVTELSRARVNDPAQVLSAGDKIEVQILEIKESTDKNGKSVEKIALSRKALEKDPWDNAVGRFPVGSKVAGKVVRLQPFGAFIEVAPGVDGLAHISTLAEKRIEHPSEAVKVGDAVEAFVLAVEPEKQRLSLSLKDPARKPAPRERPERAERAPRGDRPPRAPRPEKGAEADRPQYPVGSVHDGVVEKVETFGVFVTLPGGGRALVPNSELGVAKNADQRLDYRKVFPAGAPLRVAITELRRGELKASKVEADRADERSLVKEWSKSQKPQAGGKAGFGTLGDLFKKANLVK